MHVCNSSDNFGARSSYSANRSKSTQLINWLHMMCKHQMMKRDNCFRILPTFYSYMFPLKFEPNMLSRLVKYIENMHSQLLDRTLEQ